MNVVELILALGRWGQTHQTEMLTGLLGLPVALGVTSLVVRGRRAATTTHGSARWATLGKWGRRGSMDARAWCWGGWAGGCSVMTARRTCCW